MGNTVNKLIQADANVGSVLSKALFAPESIALIGASDFLF